MTCRSIVGAFAMFSLSTFPFPALSQAFDPATVAPNPAVEQLSRSLDAGGELVELQGFVGPSTPETVRLYKDLTLNQYLEIPRQSIVQQVSGANTSQPLTIYILSSTVVRSVTRMQAGEYGRLRISSSAALSGIPIDGGIRPIRPPQPRGLACDLHAINCLAGHALSCIAVYGCMDQLVQ
jgi:hypothetical protein